MDTVRAVRRRAEGAMTVTLSDRWLVASFPEPVRACSWAIAGGGLVDVESVAWCEVRMDEGLLEASAIATEAKTAAILEAGVLSRRSGRPATGTGTDCTVVTCTRGPAPDSYAGKHTTVGSLVGAAVESAISQGVARWLEENAPRRESASEPG